MTAIVADPEETPEGPSYYLPDHVFEALALSVAEGLSAESAMRAALLVSDHNMPPAEAVEASVAWSFDDRVRAAGAKRNRLVAQARAVMRAAEYGEGGAA
jgi:hypothetical protein